METTEVKKVYLVDSENVGDVWVTHVMEFAKPQDEIVVFYTQKSPYMSYENIRKLMDTDREIVFVKCVEGQNALDFQLVTELGYRIGNEQEEMEYVVVTNDTGFDAAVRYWKSQGKMVKRYNAKFCQMLLNQHKVQMEKKDKNRLDKQEKKENIQEKAADSITAPFVEEVEKSVVEKEHDLGEELEKEKEANITEEVESIKSKEEELKEEESKEEEPKEAEPELSPDMEDQKTEELICDLLSCIGKKNIPDFHNALIILLGEEKGKRLYKEIKGNISEYVTKKNMKSKEKFKVYCQLVFAQDFVEEEYPKNFSNFVYDAKEKRGNLNTFRAALLEKFGKDKGMIYYNIIKPHVKILNRIQKIK